MHTWVDKYWYQKKPSRWLLYPFSMIYRAIAWFKKQWSQRHAVHVDIPIIVVGNISVGGVGKTPLVITIVQKLHARGLKVGVVSRGYGAKDNRRPRLVGALDDPELVGDEPLLIAQKVAVPVVIAKKRVEAVRYLMQRHNVDVIVSDDGLQHHAMGRALDIAIVDGARGFGNGLCLPAGPLRESIARLKSVDFVVIHGQAGCFEHKVLHQLTRVCHMHLVPGPLKHVLTHNPIAAEQLTKPVAAVTGIGHPMRFFDLLRHMGLQIVPYEFADHHAFKPEDFNVTEAIIVMTEKDAVKCRSFARENMYYLPVELQIDDSFWKHFWAHQQLKGKI